MNILKNYWYEFVKTENVTATEVFCNSDSGFAKAINHYLTKGYTIDQVYNLKASVAITMYKDSHFVTVFGK